jgi:hypothetical protein
MKIEILSFIFHKYTIGKEYCQTNFCENILIAFQTKFLVMYGSILNSK